MKVETGNEITFEWETDGERFQRDTPHIFNHARPEYGTVDIVDNGQHRKLKCRLRNPEAETGKWK